MSGNCYDYRSYCVLQGSKLESRTASCSVTRGRRLRRISPISQGDQLCGIICYFTSDSVLVCHKIQLAATESRTDVRADLPTISVQPITLLFFFHDQGYNDHVATCVCVYLLYRSTRTFLVRVLQHFVCRVTTLLVPVLFLRLQYTYCSMKFYLRVGCFGGIPVSKKT